MQKTIEQIVKSGSANQRSEPVATVELPPAFIRALDLQNIDSKVMLRALTSDPEAVQLVNSGK